MALPIDDKEKKPQDAAPNQAMMGQAPTAIQRPNPQRKATGFTNIGRMLNANRGSALGSAVAGGIGAQTQQAQQGVQQAQGEFNQQAQTGRVGTEQDVEKMRSVLQDPTKATEGDVAQFQKFRTQGYVGPQGLQNSDIIASQGERARQLGNAVSSSAGRTGLLQSSVGKGQYTGGQQRLDSMLLGRQAGDQLREARRGAMGAAGDVQRGIEQARGLASQYGNEAEAFKGTVKGAIGAQEQPLTSELEKRAGQAETDKGTHQKDLLEGLQRGEITADDAKALGLDEGLNTYNLNLSDYLKTATTAANKRNVSSAEEMAKMNALAKLGGNAAFGDANEAGSFYKDQFSLRKPDLDTAIKQRKEEFESRMNPYMAGENAYRGATSMLDNVRKNNEISRKMDELGDRPGDISSFTPMSENDQYTPPTQEQIAENQKARQEYDTKYNALQSQKVGDPLNHGGLWGLINSVGRGGAENTAMAFDMLMRDNKRQQAAELLQNLTKGAHSEVENLKNVYTPEKKLRFKNVLGAVANPSTRGPMGDAG